MLRRIPYIFLFILFSSVSLALAQDGRTEQQSLLPEIDPQDIEIRSQFRARFPGLSRQPILGFNPRPRVFQVDPNRMPFIEDEEAVIASLPIGELDRPEAPDYEPLGYTAPNNGFLRAGFGSYITPEADFFGVAKLSDQNWLSTDLQFQSSDGHEERVPTSFRQFDGSIRSFNRLSERTLLTLTAGGRSDFNHQLSVVSSPTANLSVLPQTKVNADGFYASALLERKRSSLSGFQLNLAGYSDSYSVESNLDPLSGSPSEWGLELKGKASRLGNHIYEIHSIEFESESGQTSPIRNESYNWSNNRLALRFERLFNYNTDVSIALGGSAVTDATGDWSIYPYGNAEIEQNLFRGLNARAEVRAEPVLRNYSEIRNLNRFFNLDSPIRHQYEIEALAEVLAEPIEGTNLYGGVSFQDVKKYLYYTREKSPGEIESIEAGYYNARFQNATILKVYGGFSQDLKPEVIWVSADAHWQIPDLASGDRIPFTETLFLDGMLHFRPAKSILIEGWAEFFAGRKSSTGENLESFLLLGGGFEVSLTERIGIYGKLNNLLDEQYELWDGFIERGFQGFVGVTLLF
jgi:hypothetical protein